VIELRYIFSKFSVCARVLHGCGDGDIIAVSCRNPSVSVGINSSHNW